MWEYKREETKGYTPYQFMELLNSYGFKGWEIIYYNEHNYGGNDNYKFTVILKRRCKLNPFTAG